MQSVSSQSLSLCATRVVHLHKNLTTRLHSRSVWSATLLSSSTSRSAGLELSGSSRRRWRKSGGSLAAAGRLIIRSTVESAVASEQSSPALLPGQFVDGVLGVRQPAELPDEKSGASSDLIFLGTGTSEGVPRVNCVTHTSKRCPVTSSFLEESTSRSGRRALSTLCFFALTLVAFPLIGEIGKALAEVTEAKPEKKKGRAPSSPYDEDRLLEQNRRMQRLNNAPTEFPGFVREGFQVKVITSDKYVTSKSGLIYYDMVVGNGDLPQDGQQVIFHYTGYNESGRRVDSSYQQGRPARTRVGIQGMIPGFEEGIKTMRPGGRRIIIVPPELGPPVGPSTFFSAKQFEVFDVELLEAKDCSRRTLLFYSDVVCD